MVLRHFCLFLALLVSAQANPFRNKTSDSAVASKSPFEGLQQELEGLRSLLNQKEMDSSRGHPKRQIRFQETLKKVTQVLNAIEAAIKKHNTRLITYEIFEQNMALLKNDFYALIDELRDLSEEGEQPKEDLGLKTPPSASGSRSSSPARLKRRRIGDPSESSLSSANSSGTKGSHIHYRYDSGATGQEAAEDDNPAEGSRKPAPVKSSPVGEPFLDE